MKKFKFTDYQIMSILKKPRLCTHFTTLYCERDIRVRLRFINSVPNIEVLNTLFPHFKQYNGSLKYQNSLNMFFRHENDN